MILLMFLVQTFLIIFIGYLVSTNKLKHSYALPWSLGILLIPLILVTSNLLAVISDFLGFQLASNFIFVVTIIFLILNSIWLLSIIGRLEEKTNYLILEIALMKNDLRKKSRSN